MVRKHFGQEPVEYRFADALARAAFTGVLALFCFFASMQMLQDVFPGWSISRKAWTWICVLALFTAFLYEAGIRKLPRCQWICRLLVPVVYGAAVFAYAKPRQVDIEDGACAFAIQFLEKFNKHLKTSYTIWQGKPEQLGHSLALYGLVAVLLLLTLALLTGKRLFLLLLPLAALWSEMLVGYVPRWEGLACLFACVLFAAAGEPQRGGRKALRVHMGGQRKKGALAVFGQRWLPVAVLAVTTALLVAAGKLAFEAPAGRLMEKHTQVRAFQQDMEQGLSGFFSSFSVKQREAVDNAKRNYTGKEVLKVRADKRPAQDVLLKSFYGTDYVDGAWVCRQGAFSDACKEAGYTQEEAAKELLDTEYQKFLDVSSYYTQAASSVLVPVYTNGDGEGSAGTQEAEAAEQSNLVHFTIEYTGAKNKYAYLPYLVDLSKIWEDGQLEPDGDVTLLKPRGLDQFEVIGTDQRVDTWTFAPFLMMSTTGQGDGNSTPVFDWYDRFVYNHYLDVPDGLSAIPQFMQELSRTQEFWTYGTAVLNSIRSLSEERKAGQDSGNEDAAYWWLAESVRSVLFRSMDYNMKLDALPQGVDAIDYFLSESREGYCVHFATAAALLLREMGIPARYVSGYAARREDFRKTASGYVASVKDSSAHAWIELYMGGLGWVPMDVTPPGREAPQAAEANTAASESSEASTESKEDDTDTTSEEETKAEEETETDEPKAQPLDQQAGSGPGQAGILAGMGLIVLAVLSCVGLAAAIRYAIRSYQSILVKEMKAGKYRSAVIRLNQRIYRRLVWRGKVKRGMGDSGYEKALLETYPQVPKTDWARYMRVLKETAFSGGELQAQDALFCCRVYGKVAKRR